MCHPCFPSQKYHFSSFGSKIKKLNRGRCGGRWSYLSKITTALFLSWEKKNAPFETSLVGKQWLIKVCIFASIKKLNHKVFKKLESSQFCLLWCRCGLEKASNEVEDSLFPVMRLFLPQLDRERGSYGIKETLLGGHHLL